MAVSGGADSVALLRGLWELRTEIPLEITAAHLNHQLRGTASDADAAWVADLCTCWEIPLIIERGDVKRLQTETGTTLEEAARLARYAFLERSATEKNSTVIALAHTADDQAETVLFHILRGTGLSGLRGIPRERQVGSGIRIIRPLLNIPRTDIENWLAQRAQDFREDATNQDLVFTRNRLRHQLLPLLKEDYNPQVVSALFRLARQAEDAEEVLKQFAQDQLATAIVERSPNRVQLDCKDLANQPLAFRRVCLTELWQQQNWPRKRMTFAHWNNLAELIPVKRGALSLPQGLFAKQRRGQLSVEWEPKSI